MGNYSQEEIAAFGRKDKLNSRMSAVKSTSINFEGKGIDFEGFKVFADEVYSWIRQDQLDASPIPNVEQKDGGNTKERNPPSLPVPTPEQDKVLRAIKLKVELSLEEVRKSVLKYSTEVAGASSPC